MALNGHMRMHGPSGGSLEFDKVYIEKLNKWVLPSNEQAVREAIEKCPECKAFHTNPKFCSSSCSASYNNKKRERSEETKGKISDSVKKYYKENPQAINEKRDFTRGKGQEYNGVYLHSSWEVAYAKYLDSNGINWERPKNGFDYFFEGKNRLYYPDFYLPKEKTYIEIKGYKTEKDEAKWNQFSEDLKVLRKDDLEELDIL